MIAQARAELLKVRSTRTTLGLLLGLLGLALLFAFLTGLLSTAGQLVGPENQRQLLGNGTLAGAFAALAGIMLVTSEYRFGTIRPTLVYTPARGRVIAAKLAAGAVAGIVFGIIGEGLVLAIGLGMLQSRGITVSLDGGGVAQLVAGTLVGSALWGVIGVALGAIARSQVGAVIALLAWGFVVENLLFGFVPSVGRLAPVHAEDALVGLTTPHLLSAVAGSAALISWAAVLSAVGFVLTLRRDVN
jgi:ABC-type transport system involved in multi-copper enzyme maturation permease subunit